jgi:hypothetical protein
MLKNICLSSVRLAALLVGVAATRSAAQTPTAPRDSTGDDLRVLLLHAPSAYGAWVAAAHHSQFRTRTGVPGHRDFYLASIRLAWNVGGDDPARVVNGKYFIDLIPAALSTDMPEYRWNSRCQPDTYCPGATPIPHDVYAFGITPLGWALALGNGPARLTMEASAGGLWFARRIPDPLAARFNFTASAGPTLELRMTPAQSFRIGYLWHHTSNGGTGRVNPGLNSGILAAGMLWHHTAEVRGTERGT